MSKACCTMGNSAETIGCLLASRSRATKTRFCATGTNESLRTCSTKTAEHRPGIGDRGRGNVRIRESRRCSSAPSSSRRSAARRRNHRCAGLPCSAAEVRSRPLPHWPALPLANTKHPVTQRRPPRSRLRRSRSRRVRMLLPCRRPSRLLWRRAGLSYA